MGHRAAGPGRDFGQPGPPKGLAGPGRGLFGASGHRLAYVADMLQELKLIAAQAGSPTLTGLLEVAHGEAVLQSRSAPSG